MRSHQQAASREALLSKLTSREAQVLERIVAGRLNKQIADDLGISIKTVGAHRANIMEKAGCQYRGRPAQDRPGPERAQGLIAIVFIAYSAYQQGV